MNQPPGNPAEVIDVSTPSPSDEGNNVHMEAMITGRGKRLHADEDENQRENSAVDSSRLDSKEQAESKNRGSKDRMSTEGEDPKGVQLEEDNAGSGGKRARPEQVLNEQEMKTDGQEPPAQDTDEPTYEPEPMMDLSFSEMYAYLSEEVAGMDVQQAQEVLSAKDYITSMFGKVFASHPAQALLRDKLHYPELLEEETGQLMQLFLLDVGAGRAEFRRWKSRLYDIVRAVYKTNRSISEIVEHRIATAQANNGPMINPWAKQVNQPMASRNENQDMSEEKTSRFRFLRTAYGPDEVEQLRQLCETGYGFPSSIREPTEQEKKVIQGLLEGTILCAELPSFLKRVCTNEALRMIQNTIQAQVEGDLVLQLHHDFPVYPDFQTRERLVSMILLRPENGDHDKEKIVAMLRGTKQVCYDKLNHAVHLIFWTRELAITWGQVFKSLPFRNKVFKLRNEHPEDVEARSNDNNPASVWARQVGADGVRNERPRDRYHVRLLNITRFMDEAAIDAFIQQQFGGIYTTWQEPSYGNYARQTNTWDIYFKCPACPSFLAGRRFINWDGTKLLIHHVSANPAPPCFQCGASGHTRTRCNVQDHYWQAREVCIKVTAQDIAGLPRQLSTVTSFDELQKYWINEKNQPQQQKTETPRTTVSAQEPTIEPRFQRQRQPSRPAMVNQNDWQTAGDQRRSGRRNGILSGQAKQDQEREIPRTILRRRPSANTNMQQAERKENLARI